MIFADEHRWLYGDERYRSAAERVLRGAIALFELQEEVPSDAEALARQSSAYKGAMEARREVVLYLMKLRTHYSESKRQRQAVMGS